MAIKEKKESLLNSFLSTFEKLPDHIIKGMLKQAGNEDEIFYIQSLKQTITAQFFELSNNIKELSGKSTSKQLSDAEHFIKMSSGMNLLDSAKSLSSRLASPLNKLGLSSIIHFIKKIFLKLAEIFNWTLPKWVIPLLELIDEIIDFLLSMGIFKLSNAMSRNHQNYLAEMTQMAKLQEAFSSRISQDEEED